MSLDVLALVPHPIASPSGRYRVHQMAEPLGKLGVRLDIQPFLDDRAFARLYLPGRWGEKALDVARGGARRWRVLGGAGRYRLAFVHRELWPVVGDAPLRRLARHQPRWVFDFDDAIWMPNVSEVNRSLARWKPHGQATWLASHARAVAAGNGFLSAWARGQRSGRPAAEVEEIPTAVNSDLWVPVPRAPGPPRLVWIGTPTTVPHLEAVRPALARVAARHPGLEIHVIGARFDGQGLPVVLHEWSEQRERDLVGRCDIGLAPLPDSDWARGKCGLKLLLYMACGLAAVSSRVGVHPTILEDGRTGMLADSDDAFEPALERLIGDPALRSRLGAAARAVVEERYSIRAVAPRLAALLSRAAESAI
jgi:glycosyltransferase involved in cell wall biosynthesis